MQSKRQACLLRTVFLFSLLLSFVGNPQAAAPDAETARVGGDVSGQINYCGPEGSEGIQVHIPGQSFSSVTDAIGNFNLVYVPPGTWNLQFIRDGRRLGSLNSVTVIKKMHTDILATQGVITLCNDLDGDGYPPNLDCDETNPAIYPGATELCGDGKDNDCNGESDETCPTCTDNDGDGYFAQAFCGAFRDCDDNNPSINPGAQESCGDGVDNNCDGQTDEDTAYNAQAFYFDNDADGYGDNNNIVNACIPPTGYITTGGDCDDNSVVTNPGVDEVCGDSVDNNCDGQVDEAGCVNQGQCTQADLTFLETCTANCQSATCIQSCYSQTSDQCQQGLTALFTCSFAAGCTNLSGAEAEFCSYDNCTAEWEVAFGPDYVPTECNAGDLQQCGFTNTGACQFGQQTCGANGRWAACVGNVDPINEICGNSIDDDCDGTIDNNCGVCGNGILEDNESCDDGNRDNGDGCNADCINEMDADQDGYYPPVDCDDNSASTNPGAAEVCDGIDNNCNGIIDVDTAPILYPNGATECVAGTQQLVCNPGYEDCDSIISNGCEVDLTTDAANCGACGSLCNDNNVCTGAEVCSAGVCQSGTPINCDDGISCTLDSCDTQLGCVNTPYNTLCNDGLSCTQDVCDVDAGSCTNDITASTCLIGGVCYSENAISSGGCGQCTSSVSQTGWTPMSASIVCRAANSTCDVAEVCNGSSIDCPVDASVPDGSVCDDGNPSTVNDICTAGACAGTATTTVGVGGLCVSNSDCNTGLICIPTTQDLGVCYQLCTTQADCPGADACTLLAGGGSVCVPQ